MNEKLEINMETGKVYYEGLEINYNRDTCLFSIKDSNKEFYSYKDIINYIKNRKG